MGREARCEATLSLGVLFLCFVFTFGLEEEQEKSEERGGRIFYVTTTSSVSTVSTATYCYVATTATLAIPTCLKKRRRSLKILADHLADGGEEILPSRSLDDYEPENEIESSQGEERQGKFVNYWITTTFTTTSTSFTVTSSIASLICSPIGWTYNVCPGPGGR